MEDAMDQMGGHETIRITDAESEKSKPLSQDPLIGKLLDRRYLIIRELGHGGFGSVYLASDEKVMSRRVVVKVLKETGDEWSIRKFKQEIEALARVDHSGIVGIVNWANSPRAIHTL
jgi:serine/threonine protein kinase